MVAFFAYLSSDTPASVPHHNLLFDIVITNKGNVYHLHMGIFFAPRSGLYVFTLKIQVYGYSFQTTKLKFKSRDMHICSFEPLLSVHVTSYATSSEKVLLVIFVIELDLKRQPNKSTPIKYR